MQITFETPVVKITPLSKVIVPEYMKNRLSTGVDFLDECLNNKEDPGFIAGSVILLSADPGAGKSTLLRQMSAISDLDALYNVGEESLEQVKMAVERMDLSVGFDVSNYRCVEDLLTALEKNPHPLVIIDSLQNLYADFDHKGEPLKGRPGSKVQIVTVTEKIYAYAKATLTTFFLICHSTKGGDFAGPQTIEHTIDVSLHIEVTEDKEAGMMYRTLKAEKNRFGQAFIDYNLTMSAKGLQLGDAPPPQMTEKGKAKSKTNKTAVKKFAREIYGPDGDCQFKKDEFVRLLMEASDCEPHTAISYYYMLKRENGFAQPASK